MGHDQAGAGGQRPSAAILPATAAVNIRKERCAMRNTPRGTAMMPRHVAQLRAALKL
jgi:hypothetical protein